MNSSTKRQTRSAPGFDARFRAPNQSWNERPEIAGIVRISDSPSAFAMTAFASPVPLTQFATVAPSGSSCASRDHSVTSAKARAASGVPSSAYRPAQYSVFSRAMSTDAGHSLLQALHPTHSSSASPSAGEVNIASGPCCSINRKRFARPRVVSCSSPVTM